MKTRKIFSVLITLLVIIGFTTIGQAEEESMLGKIKEMFSSGTEADEKDAAEAESENLETRESADVAESGADITPPPSEEEGEVILNIDGMTCTACEDKVKAALMNCEGVEYCEVNWYEGKATVKVAKGSSNTTDMINAVEKTGYTASAKLEENIQYGAEPEIKGTEESEAIEEESNYREKW